MFRKDAISGFEFPEGLNCEDFIYMYEVIKRTNTVAVNEFPLYFIPLPYIISKYVHFWSKFLQKRIFFVIFPVFFLHFTENALYLQHIHRNYESAFEYILVAQLTTPKVVSQLPVCSSQIINTLTTKEPARTYGRFLFLLSNPNKQYQLWQTTT